MNEKKFNEKGLNEALLYALNNPEMYRVVSVEQINKQFDLHNLDVMTWVKRK